VFLLFLLHTYTCSPYTQSFAHPNCTTPGCISLHLYFVALCCFCTTPGCIAWIILYTCILYFLVYFFSLFIVMSFILIKLAFYSMFFFLDSMILTSSMLLQNLKAVPYKWWRCIVKVFHFQRIWIHKRACMVKSCYLWCAMCWFRYLNSFFHFLGSDVWTHMYW